MIEVEDNLAKLFDDWRVELVRGRHGPPRDLSSTTVLSMARGKEIKAIGLWAQFTRDAGMFHSGALASKAHDRCLSLALAFYDPILRTRVGLPLDRPLAERVCKGAFGAHVDRVWVEPPANRRDLAFNIHAFRLFVGGDWTTPVEGAPPVDAYVPWALWRAGYIRPAKASVA